MATEVDDETCVHPLWRSMDCQDCEADGVACCEIVCVECGKAV